MSGPLSRRLAACTMAALTGLATPALAQEPETTELCGSASGVEDAVGDLSHSRLGREVKGRMDGGQGRDRIVFPGPSFRVIGQLGEASFERIDLLNGQFDTMVVPADYLGTVEDKEVDLRLDPFDTVIPDPNLTWQRLSDRSLAFDAYKAQAGGKELSILVPPGAYVLRRDEASGRITVAGAKGPLTWPVPVTNAPAVESRISEDSLSLSWPEGGTVRPDLKGVSAATRELELDFLNGEINVIELSFLALASGQPRLTRITADPFDQLVLRDRQCWTMQRGQDGGPARLGSDQEDGLSARVELPDSLLASFAAGRLQVANAEAPGIWHLSSDTATSRDVIDLRNGGKDTLILRNDRRLRNGYRWILGDPGDEVWLEGSSGWTIGTGDFGTEARVQQGAAEDPPLVLRFQPGLMLRMMPMPPFLNDPALLERPFYPGLKDEITAGSILFVTRGGYVRFSAAQIANRATIDMHNGMANILAIEPGLFANAASGVVLTGDAGRDIILASGMPEPEILASGDVVWTMPPDGPGATGGDPGQGARVITARGLKVFNAASAETARGSVQP